MARRFPKDWPALLGWIILANAAGLVGSIANRRSAEFYATLAQPEWAPPSWVFAPVWTLLYVFMGIAAWLVWRTDTGAAAGATHRAPPPSEQLAAARRRGLGLFLVQLAFNALWTWIFFAWRQGAMAFAEILVLWVLIALTMHAFARVERVAAWLLAPYLAWVTFATALTWAIWRGNAGVL
jgi:tryptophan-rich sensory protein